MLWWNNGIIFSDSYNLFQIGCHVVIIHYTLYKLILNNQIKMPINFDINDNNESCARFYACAIFLFGFVQFEYMSVLDTSQIWVFRFWMPNATLVEAKLYYDIPYEDCHCSVAPTKNCLTNRQLRITRVLPLILFVLQVQLIRKSLSFSVTHTHFLVNAYWIISIFIFFGILVIIYRSSYYYELTAKILLCASSSLFSIVIRHVISDT